MKITRTEKYKDLREQIKRSNETHKQNLADGKFAAVKIEKAVSSMPVKGKHAKKEDLCG